MRNRGGLGGQKARFAPLPKILHGDQAYNARVRAPSGAVRNMKPMQAAPEKQPSTQRSSPGIFARLRRVREHRGYSRRAPCGRDEQREGSGDGEIAGQRE